MAILRVKLDWLLDALWRPLFLVIESSWSQLGTSSKMDSGRLKLYTKSLRNFNKKYALSSWTQLGTFPSADPDRPVENYWLKVNSLHINEKNSIDAKFVQNKQVGKVEYYW